MKRSKGFTLVEVLIVVVIIAILASLIMPRMMAQTGKAKAAEVFQMVGAMKRAAERQYDLARAYPMADLYTDSSGGIYGDWSVIGLKPPSSKNWEYGYSSWGPSSYYVYGYRYEGGAEAYVLYEDGIGWTCDGTVFTNGGDPSKPCTIA